MHFSSFLRSIILVLLCSILVTGSNALPGDSTDQVRKYTREIEFDYVSWMADALGEKIAVSTLSLPQFLPSTAQHDLVLEYLNLVDQTHSLSDQILQIYSDPKIADPQSVSLEKREQLKALTDRMHTLQPIAESILQSQISAVLADWGLTFLGQPIPPVLYHCTPLPYALIVSPRTIIRQDADISLQSNLTIEQIVSLEDQVSQGLNVSALVEEIGGVGVYPTMVEESSSLEWLSETIAHEWIHNYLTLRPLGIHYDSTPELRTMNETTAAIAGDEIGLEVLRRYYPEKVPHPSIPQAENPSGNSGSTGEPPEFNFQAEMHTTRVEVDRLLAAGRVTEAEAYMEQRRQVFWEHGYAIRKLNQAYFAFHGAYADEAGGAAGEDPVGPKVRALRAQSSSLADFIRRISWMSSFDQLEQAVQQSSQPGSLFMDPKSGRPLFFASRGIGSTRSASLLG